MLKYSNNVTKEFFNDPKNLVAVLNRSVIKEDIRDFVKNLNKERNGTVLSKHFHSNGKRGFLVHHCNGSPYIAMRKSGISLFPWQMSNVPRGFYEIQDNRTDAIRWAFAIKKYTIEEFRCKSAYLMKKYYTNSIISALDDAGFTYRRNGTISGVKPIFNAKNWYKTCKARWLMDS